MRSLNNRQLGKWLMKEVHDVDLPRRKARKSHGRGPARSAKYRSWIRSLPCSCCGIEPAGEAAHTGSDGGMRQKASDYSCVPLCTDCHTMAPHAYHRIGREAFESRHNVAFSELVRRLNHLWFAYRNEVK